jgi:hypothetical protein
VPHPAGSACRAFDQRRPAVNRKLRLASEDDEHFLATIVKVMADASPRHYLATVDEVEIGRHISAFEKPLACHVASAAVRLAALILARVGVLDALG